VTAGLTAGINIPFAKGSPFLENLIPGFGNKQLTMAKLLNGFLDDAISAGISSLAYDTDFGTTLLNSMLQTVISAVAGAGIYEVAEVHGHLAQSIEKTLAKALINCAAAEATGGDCAAAAAGTIITDLAFANGLTADTPDQLRKQVQLIAAVSGWLLSGGDPSKVYDTVDAALLDYDNNIAPALAIIFIIGALTAADYVLTAYDAYDLATTGLACDGGDQSACDRVVEMAKEFAFDTAIGATIGTIIPGDKVGLKHKCRHLSWSINASPSR
ncbi:DUF637 domain-containing protein, partial [Neorhizobium sp. T786]|uniref:DUF637 domain-containing protein n=1 Tax=Pseudorhizobium xiangyangii TaxID=2883104 RepID=UPI001CFFBCB0